MESFPTVVFQSRQRRACSERALVLRALNIEHGVEADGQGWTIWVPGHMAEAALGELRSYELERRQVREQPTEPAMVSDGKRGVLAYAVILCALFPAGMYGLFGANFWLAGMMDSKLVMEGQWWRPFTSLTLHADIGHLVGNLFFGAVFVVLLGHLLGTGWAWLATLASGVLGNLLTTVIRGPGHLAVGASTAVFGALGLFTFYEWMRRRKLRGQIPKTQRFRAIAPLLGGAVLLGWLGMGGGDGTGRTDVLSHLTGFAMGGVLGGVMAWFGWPNAWVRRTQAPAAAICLALLVVAWAAALAG